MVDKLWDNLWLTVTPSKVFLTVKKFQNWTSRVSLIFFRAGDPLPLTKPPSDQWSVEVITHSVAVHYALT